MIFYKGTKVNQLGKESLSTNSAETTSRKMDFDLYLTPYTTVNLTWLIALNIKLSENTTSLSW